MATISVIHGPNLNLLGERESATYGSESLESINATIKTQANTLEHEIKVFQSNTEGDLVDYIQTSKSDGTDFIIINPAAYTHTSVALRDALLAVQIPFIEVHLSNMYTREPFRHTSYFSDIAVGVICGFGSLGYQFALTAAHHHLLHPKEV